MHTRRTIVLIVILILFGLVTTSVTYKNYNNKVGKIFIASESISDLQKRMSNLSIDRIKVTSCKWYEQINRKSGHIFIFTDLCYNGKLILEDEYYNSIISRYNWQEYSYPISSKEGIDAGVYGTQEIYGSNMINEALRTKRLYISEEYDGTFASGTFFTFLNKESRTLYFYYLIL